MREAAAGCTMLSYGEPPESPWLRLDPNCLKSSCLCFLLEISLERCQLLVSCVCLLSLHNKWALLECKVIWWDGSPALAAQWDREHLAEVCQANCLKSWGYVGKCSCIVERKVKPKNSPSLDLRGYQGGGGERNPIWEYLVLENGIKNVLYWLC